MKIIFSETDPQKVVQNIKDALGSRELAKMVDFALQGKDLIVTISKFGTSTLTFSNQAAKSGGLQYELTGEKIAFAHKALKGEVTNKLLKVIESAGGKIAES